MEPSLRQRDSSVNSPRALCAGGVPPRPAAASSPLVAVECIMMDLAQCLKVVLGVFSLLHVGLYVVKFQSLAGVFRRQHGTVPPAFHALEAVPPKYADAPISG